MNYNFYTSKYYLTISEFLDSIKNYSKNEMISAVRDQLLTLKNCLNDQRAMGKKNEIKQTLALFSELRILLIFLESNQFPEYTVWSKIKKFRWLAEKLVQNGEMPQKVLLQFEK